jgi:hypothetical protein
MHLSRRGACWHFLGSRVDRLIVPAFCMSVLALMGKGVARDAPAPDQRFFGARDLTSFQFQ